MNHAPPAASAATLDGTSSRRSANGCTVSPVTRNRRWQPQSVAHSAPSEAAASPRTCGRCSQPAGANGVRATTPCPVTCASVAASAPATHSVPSAPGASASIGPMSVSSRRTAPVASARRSTPGSAPANHAAPSGPSAAWPLSGGATGVATSAAPGATRPIATPSGRAIETHAPPSEPTTNVPIGVAERDARHVLGAGRRGEHSQRERLRRLD